jgi:hypothetical protein
MTDLEEFVLGTLSFYEPMTFSKIIIDLDSDALLGFPEFTREDLTVVLSSLEKQKVIKTLPIDKESGWIRIHPKKALWKRLLSL